MTRIPVIRNEHNFRIIDEKNEEQATAMVYQMNGVRWLTNVWVAGEARGQGYGSAIIEAALAEYAAHDLYLQVHPYIDRPFDEAALAEWYRRFGFVDIPDAPGLMKRPAAPFDPERRIRRVRPMPLWA